MSPDNRKPTLYNTGKVTSGWLSVDSAKVVLNKTMSPGTCGIGVGMEDPTLTAAFGISVRSGGAKFDIKVENKFEFRNDRLGLAGVIGIAALGAAILRMPVGNPEFYPGPAQFNPGIFPRTMG